MIYTKNFRRFFPSEILPVAQSLLIRKENWLFPRQKQGAHICEQSVTNVFQKHLDILQHSEEGYTLHSLRHGFGLHLYEAGTDLMTIKEAMGHKSLSSTETYLRLGIGNGRSVKSPYDF